MVARVRGDGEGLILPITYADGTGWVDAAARPCRGCDGVGVDREVALTVLLASIVTLQMGSVPLQSPVQPVKL
jgi:hypothetical protein